MHIATRPSRDIPALVADGVARLGITDQAFLTDRELEREAFVGCGMALGATKRGRGGQDWTAEEVERTLGGWILAEGSQLGLEFLERVLGRSPTISCTVRSYEEAIVLAEEGLGGAVCYTYVVDPDSPRLQRVLHGEVDAPVFGGAICWRRPRAALAGFERDFVELFLKSRSEARTAE